jgi:hypothetical protein
MKKPRPSNLVMNIGVSILMLIALYIVGAIIYHLLKEVSNSNEVIKEPKQELLN